MSNESDGLRKINEKVVYCVRAVNTDFYKIGFTVQLQSRIRELQVGCPWALKVFGYREGDQALESALHKRFEDNRVRGEWFEFTDDKPLLEVFPENPSPAKIQNLAIAHMVRNLIGVEIGVYHGAFWDCQLGAKVILYQIMPEDKIDNSDWWLSDVESRQQWYTDPVLAAVYFCEAYGYEKR